MNAQTLGEIRELLESRGLSPKKSLGQNFLIDRNLVAKLVDEAGVGDGDLVLEVGPGTGTLTGELLGRGCEVVACELDDGLSGLLRDRFAEQGRFSLIQGDCLASKRELSGAVLAALGGRRFKLVANLPYQAATPLLLTLLTRHRECRGMYVTIQKEVADRLLEGPGSKTYGSVGVVAQCVARVRRIANLPNECFWPRPKVTSSMVGLEPLDEPLTPDPAWLADFCQRVFAGRRKQLFNLLRSLGLSPETWPENIPRTARIEGLSPPEIAGLAEAARSR